MENNTLNAGVSAVTEGFEIEKFFSKISDTPSSRAVNYIGFGLKLRDCLDLARKLRDEPYPYEKVDGKTEYERDVITLTEKLGLLDAEYLANKERWSK
jgi:hypothetical protein